jgi:hypothetical protein
MSEPEFSNAMLRAVLIIAARRIKQLNFGKRDDRVLRVLRRVYRETRRHTIISDDQSHSNLGVLHGPGGHL